jgi:hypothetical protein
MGPRDARRKISVPTNGRPTVDDPAPTGIPATKWPHSAQEARPAGHNVEEGLSI